MRYFLTPFCSLKSEQNYVINFNIINNVIIILKLSLLLLWLYSSSSSNSIIIILLPFILIAFYISFLAFWVEGWGLVSRMHQWLIYAVYWCICKCIWLYEIWLMYNGYFVIIFFRHFSFCRRLTIKMNHVCNLSRSVNTFLLGTSVVQW